MSSVEATIRTILGQIGDVPNDADASADLYSDLGMASVHALQLLTELEERFNLHIPDDAFVDARSISSLTSTVSGLLNQSN